MKRIQLCTVFPLLALFCGPTLAAQDKAAFDPASAKVQPVGLPSPIDKFLGLDEALKEKKIPWGQVYNDTAKDAQMDALTNDPDICLALGVKIADGVMAIKAQDAQALNDCARQIEDLAGKLGVTKDDLSRAELVRADANRGLWFKVFLELGFLQTDILKALQRDDNLQRRTLIVASGWLQGAHYAAGAIAENYTPENSNFLREPMLVKALLEELRTLSNEVRGAAKVKKLDACLAELLEIVNIALDGVIPEEKVKRMRDLSGELASSFLL